MTAIAKIKDFRPTSVVIIDNFKFQENVQHQIIDDKNSFHSYITDLYVHDQISLSGLHQSMLNLTSLNQLNYIHSLQQNQNQIEIELCHYFISETLFTAYPNKLINVFETESDLYSCLVLSEVNKLYLSESMCMSLLNSILMFKSTYNGLYEIFHTIFTEQFNMDKNKNFHESLYLVYDDQKIEKTLFHHLEELVLHSFDVHITAMFLQLIRDIHTMLNTTDSDAVQAVISDLQIKSVCQSGELMERMRDCSVCHPKTDFKTQFNIQSSDVPQLSDENYADVIMTVHTQFLHLVKIYKLIKAGTKHGDVELLFQKVEQSILHFT
ncbi:hypothetical protein LOZ64_002459 [Ophidiomyces ophidiicola]|nr:hypothetical protein LOZ64_002459 [Ophidiomyces ophidiicola]